MLTSYWPFFVLLIIPIFFATMILLFKGSYEKIMIANIFSIVISFFYSVFFVIDVLNTPDMIFAYGMFKLDLLSMTHLLLVDLVFLLVTIYAYFYFAVENSHIKKLTSSQAVYFAGFWQLTFFSLNLVFISNNVAINWIGVESVTIATAFLLGLHPTARTFEAMWKYVIICSVAMAVAFVGILIVVFSAKNGPILLEELLNYDKLKIALEGIHSDSLKIGLIFVFVGFGTKAGIAPLHTWLPDAHGEAPAPVSAVLSGVTLSTALYCIIRYLPLCSDLSWFLEVFSFFGIISILVAGIFIIWQVDLKRMLAYSSIEHLGVILISISLGTFGTVIALFHTMAHSIAKSLAFMSAGKLALHVGSNNISDIRPVIKFGGVWGYGLLISVLILIGIAPFAIFISEILLLRELYLSQKYYLLALLIFGLLLVLTGVFRHSLRIAFKHSVLTADLLPLKSSFVEKIIVFLLILILFLLGPIVFYYGKEYLYQAALLIV